MKRILLIGLIALFIFVPNSLYTYESLSDKDFVRMSDVDMHNRHHYLSEEWIEEALQKGDIADEEANWYRNHHEEMHKYAKSRRFGCH